jgi:hypothetical protein
MRFQLPPPYKAHTLSRILPFIEASVSACNKLSIAVLHMVTMAVKVVGMINHYLT